VSIREEVRELSRLGSLPDEQSVVQTPSLDERVELFQHAIENIAPPVTREEAELLLSVFGPDTCFGLAWAVLHLIESAPGGAPFDVQPPDHANEWVRLLWQRLVRAKAFGGSQPR
jgi:hypothetical protein